MNELNETPEMIQAKNLYAKYKDEIKNLKNESENESREMKYDVFISYRHLPLDKAVAQQLQKLLENYKPPKGINYANTSKIKRVFRDESELPTSNDIRTAIEQSRYLVVLVSPKLKESKWCLQEIEHFKELHGGRTNNILPILIEGGPEAFPDALRRDVQTITLEDGSKQEVPVEVEPLASNIIGKSIADSLKKLKTEFLRVAAPVLGCAFDDLYGRHQRRARQRIMSLSAGVLAVVSIFVGSVLYQNTLIQKERDNAVANEILAKDNEAKAIEQEKIAKDNEAKAVEQEKIAKEQEKIALENEATAKENEQTALKNQSLALASRSQDILHTTSDRPLALLLAREALPENLAEPEKPLTKEAQWAMFESLYTSMAFQPVFPNSIYTAYSQTQELAFAVQLNEDNTYTAGFWDYVGNLIVELDKEKSEFIDRVFYASFSPDGEIFVTTRKIIENEVTTDWLFFQVWDVKSGALLSENSFGRYTASTRATGYYPQFEGIQFVGDNNFLITGVYYIGAYNSKSGEVKSLNTEYAVICIPKIIPQNMMRYAFTVNHTLKVIDCKTFNVDLEITLNEDEGWDQDWGRMSSYGNDIEIDVDGKYVHVYSAMYGSMCIFDMLTGEYLDDFMFENNYSENFNEYAMEDTARKSMFRGETYNYENESEINNISVEILGDTVTSFYNDNKVNSFNFPQTERSMWEHHYVGLMYQFHYNEQYMYFCDPYAGSNIGEIIIIVDSNTHEIVNVFEIGTGHITWGIGDDIFTKVSHDGKHLIYYYEYYNGSGAISGNKIEVYNALTGKIINTFEDDKATYFPICGFTSDGLLWTTPGVDGNYITFYDIDKQEYVSVIDPPNEELRNLTFSDNGKYIAGYGENSGYVWNAETGELISRLDIKNKSVEDERLRDGFFLENEGVIITTTTTNSMIIWDYMSGLMLAQLPATEFVRYTSAPTLHDDGKSLIVYTNTGEYLYEFKPEDMISQTNDYLKGRVLNTLERRLNYCEVNHGVGDTREVTGFELLEIPTNYTPTEVPTVPAPPITTEPITTSPLTEPLVSDYDYYYDYVVIATNLNVRSSPSIESDVVEKLQYGEVITIYEIQGEWGKIDNGWVNMEWVEIYFRQQGN